MIDLFKYISTCTLSITSKLNQTENDQLDYHSYGCTFGHSHYYAINNHIRFPEEDQYSESQALVTVIL
jgi:hypothetical protein